MSFNDEIFLQPVTNKIISFDQINNLAKKWRAAGERVVFTNGCFDLIHYGHIYYLAEARGLGDRLVVGMNASASVSRLKGPHRPIKDEQTRLFVLASLSMVDAVVIFEEDTPYRLIKEVQPDILVKGGDWAIDQIVGADLVLQNGGQVKNLAFIEGYSTTNIEQKIKNQLD